MTLWSCHIVLDHLSSDSFYRDSKLQIYWNCHNQVSVSDTSTSESLGSEKNSSWISTWAISYPFQHTSTGAPIYFSFIFLFLAPEPYTQLLLDLSKTWVPANHLCSASETQMNGFTFLIYYSFHIYSIWLMMILLTK